MQERTQLKFVLWRLTIEDAWKVSADRMVDVEC